MRGTLSYFTFKKWGETKNNKNKICSKSIDCLGVLLSDERLLDNHRLHVTTALSNLSQSLHIAIDSKSRQRDYRRRQNINAI